MKEMIETMINQKDLSAAEMETAMQQMMSGEMDPIHMASFLTALKAKGESVTEIYAGAKVMREKAATIELDAPISLDTCGTGGDGAHTFNISTGVALIAAASGIPVVKHGNRSVSSRCGCADVLEALGAVIDLTPEEVEKCVQQCGIGFLYAPTFHSAMRFVGPVRKALGFRTIFNILGPLANPANATHQLVGVFDKALIPVFSEALIELGLTRGMVVHGCDGLDEITLAGETYVSEIRDGGYTTYTISPEEFGFERADTTQLAGGNPEENKEILLGLLHGEKGAKRDVLLINAGVALYLCDQATTIQEGIDQAAHLIDDAVVLDTLNRFVACTQAMKEV